MAARGEQVIPEQELEGRRAVNGWVYGRNRRATLHGYRAGRVPEGWLVALVHPRAKFCRSVSPVGRKSQLIHLVREQVVAERGDVRVTLTRYWCGSASFYGKLQVKYEGTDTCPKCLFFRGRETSGDTLPG